LTINLDVSADEFSWILDIDIGSCDQTTNDAAIDRLEEIALRVSAPTKSLRSVSDTVRYVS